MARTPKGPKQVETLTHDEALVLVFRAELSAAPTTPHGTKQPREKEEQ